MRILEDLKLDFDDVLIVPKRSEGKSRADIDLSRTFKTKHSETQFSCIPIFPSNMYATGSIKMFTSLSEHNIMGTLHKYYTIKEIEEFTFIPKKCFITFGESEDESKRLQQFIRTRHVPFFICIDVANGYRSTFVDYISKVRHLHSNAVLMVGNVCTADMTSELILAGADIIKIGIGSGLACTTREKTAVGYPQLSAIIECADTAHGLGGLICSDGGCRTVGDVCRSFCAGADFVMLGGMLAGTDECNGEWGISIMEGKKKYLKFFGMSSYEAMEQFGGKEKEYRASEGKCIEIPYKGPVDNVIKEILGGLRSCGTYIGANRIKDFSKCATFARIT